MAIVLQGTRGPGVCVLGGGRMARTQGRTQPLSLALRLSGGARGPGETKYRARLSHQRSREGALFARMPVCWPPAWQPGEIRHALLAMGTGRRVEARRATSILDPKGQGVCEMGGLDNQHRNSQKAEKVWVEKQTVGSCRGPPVHPLLVGRTS